MSFVRSALNAVNKKLDNIMIQQSKMEFVLVVDTAAGAEFCDKSTIFVYINNFLRCSILFSLICFLLIYSLKHNNQSVLMVDTTAGAGFCHGDTIFSIAQLVMRKLLFSYLLFLRYDMFFVNQVALFFLS